MAGEIPDRVGYAAVPQRAQRTTRTYELRTYCQLDAGIRRLEAKFRSVISSLQNFYQNDESWRD